MAITVVNNSSATGNPLTLPSTPAAGNLLIVTWESPNTGSSITDNVSGTYTSTTALFAASASTTGIAYKLATGSETSITVSSGSAGLELGYYEVSGLANPVSVDTSNINQNIASGKTASTTAITTTLANDFIVAAVGASSTITAPTWDTLSNSGNNVQPRLADGYVITSSTVSAKTYTLTWTTNNRTSSSVVYAFKGATLPSLTVSAATSISNTYALGNGNIVNVGGSTITESGFVWNTTGTPTTSDNKINTGPSTTGAYSLYMTGLTNSTAYFYRAYAINSFGTSYSSGVGSTFTTTNTALGGNTANFMPFFRR